MAWELGKKGQEAQAWDKVNNPGEIEKHLKDLCDRQVVAEILSDNRDNEDQVFQGTFRRCEGAGGKRFVVLDTLRPSGMIQLLSEHSFLSLLYFFDASGVGLDLMPYYFDSQGLGQVPGDLPAMRVAWPGVIHRMQRRQFFRVDPSPTEPVRVLFPHFPGGGEVAFEQKVADVSSGGFSVRMRAPAVSEGQEVGNILIVLPDQYSFTVSALVRRIIREGRWHPDYPLRAAFEITRFEPRGAEEQLSRYIFRQQREMIRRLKRGR